MTASPRLLSEPLPFAPRPFSDELLLSWLCRVAAANHLNFDSLFPALMTMSYYHLNFDPGPDVLVRVAAIARLDTERLMALLLRNRFPLLLTVSFLRPPTAPVWPNNDGPDMSLLLPFCGQCAGEAERRHAALYWEVEWGLPTTLFCPRHSGPTEYACPLCGHFILTLVWLDDRAAVRCTRCTWRPATLTKKKPTATSRPTGLKSLLFQLQRDLAAALSDKSPSTFWLGDISPAQFLAVVDDLYWLLRTPGLSATGRPEFTFVDYFRWTEAHDSPVALFFRVRNSYFRTWKDGCKIELLAAIAVTMLGHRAYSVIKRTPYLPVLSGLYPWNQILSNLHPEHAACLLDRADRWPLALKAPLQIVAMAEQPSIPVRKIKFA